MAEKKKKYPVIDLIEKPNGLRMIRKELKKHPQRIRTITHPKDEEVAVEEYYTPGPGGGQRGTVRTWSKAEFDKEWAKYQKAKEEAEAAALGL